MKENSLFMFMLPRINRCMLAITLPIETFAVIRYMIIFIIFPFTNSSIKRKENKKLEIENK